MERPWIVMAIDFLRRIFGYQFDEKYFGMERFYLTVSEGYQTYDTLSSQPYHVELLHTFLYVICALYWLYFFMVSTIITFIICTCTTRFALYYSFVVVKKHWLVGRYAWRDMKMDAASHIMSRSDQVHNIPNFSVYNVMVKDGYYLYEVNQDRVYS